MTEAYADGAEGPRVMPVGWITLLSAEAKALNIMVDDHFDVWFSQAYGGAPEVLQPELTAGMVHALYDAVFEAHVAENRCIVSFSLGAGATRVECVATPLTEALEG